MEDTPNARTVAAADFRRSLLDRAGCKVFARRVHPSQLSERGDYAIRPRTLSNQDELVIVGLDSDGRRQAHGVLTFPDVAFSIGVPLTAYRQSRALPIHELLWEARPNVWLTPDDVVIAVLMDWGLLAPHLASMSLLLRFLRLREECDSRWGQVFEMSFEDETGHSA